MDSFLKIGVPLLSITFYIFAAGLIYGLATKWMQKCDWHKKRNHHNWSSGGCDACQMQPILAAALWPIAGFFLLGTMLATKKRMKKAERIAKRIRDLEGEVFG